MARINIDLNTKIVRADVDIYLARAGRKGHLLPQVIASKAIGPDFPDLNLRLAKGINDDPQIEEKIKRSAKLKSWLSKSPSSRGERPPHSLEKYKDARKPAGYANYEWVIRTYFEEIKQGDLVIIPSPSQFGDAYFGEFLALGEKPFGINGVDRYEGFTFDARPFALLNETRMAALPRFITDRTKVPSGLVKIKDPRIKNRIIELTYDDFVFDDVFSSRVTTTEQRFTAFDASVINAFVTMVALNIQRLEEGNKTLSGLREAAFIDLENEGPEVKININSPGHLLIKDASLVPLVVSSLLGLAIYTGFDASQMQAMAQDIDVTNSKVTEAQDLCAQGVSERTRQMLQFSEEAEFQETCALLKQAHDSTGVKSGVIVDGAN